MSPTVAIKPLYPHGGRPARYSEGNQRDPAHLISSRCDFSSADRKFSMYTTKGSLETICTEYESSGHCSEVPFASSSANRLSLTRGRGFLWIRGTGSGESICTIGL